MGAVSASLGSASLASGRPERVSERKWKTFTNVQARSSLRAANELDTPGTGKRLLLDQIRLPGYDFPRA